MRAFGLIAIALTLAIDSPRAWARHWDALGATIFRNYPIDSGLAVSSPLAVAVDGAGFVWLATENGLARWDGYRFRIYRAHEAGANGLPDNAVMALHTDPLGRMWVGTYAGGLAVYDPRTDHFTPLRLEDTPTQSEILAIADDAGGGVLVGATSGLYRVAAGLTTLSRIVAGDRITSGIGDTAVNAVLRDREGAIWVGTEAGVSRAAAPGVQFKPVALPSKGPAPVLSLIQDSLGRVWVGTRNGAFVIEPGTGAARAISQTVRPAEAAAGQINNIAEVEPGRIWLGTSDGIVEVAADEPDGRRITRDLRVASSLPADKVVALAHGADGLTWVVTRHALSLHDPGLRAISTVFGATSDPDGLSEPDVCSLAQTPDGHVLAGFCSEGIDLLDPSGKRLAHVDLAAPSEGQQAVSAGYVGALLATPDGTVLAGTRRGLYRVDVSGRTARRLTVPGRAESGLVTSVAWWNGSVWLGGMDGVWQISVDGSGTVHTLRHEASRLADPRVLALQPGADGLWVGGIGLSHVTTEGVERIVADAKNPAGLPSQYAQALAIDPSGRLWVGTLDAGLAVLRGDPGHRRFDRVTTADGLPNTEINALLDGPDGRMWASTDQGLAVIDPRNLKVQALVQADGVAIATYWSVSAARTREDELLFGGQGGITIVRPDALEHQARHPTLAVISTRTGKRALAPGAPLGGTAIEVMPEANSVAVEFALLDYRAPERVRYAYRLDGFDTDWSETDAEHRVATYTNLPPGLYRLRIRAAPFGGTWSEASGTLPIQVHAAWFQTRWFHVACLAGGAALVLALVQARTAYLRRRQARLEHLVIERTTELRQSEAQLRHLAFNDLLTGLPNRRAFNEVLRDALAAASASGQRVTLLLLDLDGFKRVNDSMGHDAGDALLELVAERLRHAMRESDFVARLGGDEFVVVLPDEAAQPICERVVAALTADFQLPGGMARIGTSIGIALYPDDGRQPEDLYKSADIALYEAKRTGRGKAVRSARSKANMEPLGGSRDPERGHADHMDVAAVKAV